MAVSSSGAVAAGSRGGAWELCPVRVLHVPPLSALRGGLPAPEYPSDHISLIADFSSRRITGQQQQSVHQRAVQGCMQPAKDGAHSRRQHIRFGED